MTEISVNHLNHYTELRKKEEKAKEEVMAAIFYAVHENPDALRAAIGSAAFRKAEEYRSLNEQADAALEEWIAQ